jgi:hypothetical protein
VVTRQVGVTDAEDERFFATAKEIMSAEEVQRRAQVRMRKTPAEFAENLKGLVVARLGKADIIAVSVISPSKDFARDCVNALMDEYLRFRQDKAAQAIEPELRAMTVEMNRLARELKVKDAELAAYTNDHSSAADPGAAKLRDEQAKIHDQHDVILGQMLKLEAANPFADKHQVTMLEYSSVEAKSVGW